MPIYAELCGSQRNSPCDEGTYRVGVVGGAPCLAYRVLQQCRHAVATSVLDLVQFSPGLPTAAEALTLLRLHLQ